MVMKIKLWKLCILSAGIFLVGLVGVFWNLLVDGYHDIVYVFFMFAWLILWIPLVSSKDWSIDKPKVGS